MAAANDFILTPELGEFHRKINNFHLGALWNDLRAIVPARPETDVEPYLWKGNVVFQVLMESGQLITPENGGERRVIYLQNPGMKKRGLVGYTTHTLYAGIQLLLPGEIAPSHRHTQSAIRLIIEGEGAYTAVDGEKIYMEPGDFVLTPAGTWHDHGHEGNKPMIWMDGLDAPLIHHLSACFFESHPQKTQPIEYPENYSVSSFAGGMVRPINLKERAGSTSLFSYKFSRTEAALKGLRQLTTDPFDGYGVEYVNPNTGKSADPRIGAIMQVLPPAFKGKAHRHLSSSVYHVVSGKGYSVINGEKFEWEKGDFMVVPPWAVHEHVNESKTEDSVLFSINDIPLMETLNLRMKQELEEGYQKVERVFEPLQ
jgi:gentisate 1,2-dioxygenase